MPLQIIHGDLLDQPVGAIVNPWNRNTIPWWLLLPQGVSGAIKRRGGVQPFVEVARYGRLQLGQAVVTSAGRLPFRAIIHVAGIDDLWRGSERTSRLCVQNALGAACERGITSVAFPLIGTGSGSAAPDLIERAMVEELERGAEGLELVLVKYRP